MLLATHPAGSSRPPVGKVREETVYEQFFTTLPSSAFTPADVLDLYLHRGSFETVLADEDEEQASDRWVSRTQWGQEFWQIINQWIWNLRLELGQHAQATTMRLTDLTYSQVQEPPTSPPDDDPPPDGTPPPVPTGPAPPSAETAPVDPAISPPAPLAAGEARGLAERAGLASVIRATPMGTTLLYPWISWLRVYAATRWDAALPGRPSAVCARTQARAQRLAPCAVCRPHWPLPPVPAARTVSRIRHHQEAAPGERRLLAAHLSSCCLTSRMCCAWSPRRNARLLPLKRHQPLLPSCSGSAGALGRLATLPDPTDIRPAPADADSADLLSRDGNARSREASFPATLHQSRACSLATLLGATARPQCSPSHRPSGGNCSSWASCPVHSGVRLPSQTRRLIPPFSSCACSSPGRFSSPIRLHPCFSLFLLLPHLFAAPQGKLAKEKRDCGRIEGMRRPLFLLLSSSKTHEP